MTTDLVQDAVVSTLTAENVMQAVRSFYPGRLRLRHAALQGLDAETIEFVRQWLCSERPSLELEINPRVGSMLLQWDPAVLNLDLDELAQQAAGMLITASSMGMIGEKQNGTSAKRDRLEPERLAEGLTQAGEAGLDMLAKIIAPDVSKGGRAKRVAQNRLMLGVLGISVASLAGGGSRAHVYFGTAFMILLGVHLWQHRRVL